jgi:sulfatase maturation enzyme AslB (radical SAM superfamily)
VVTFVVSSSVIFVLTSDRRGHGYEKRETGAKPCQDCPLLKYLVRCDMVCQSEQEEKEATDEENCNGGTILFHLGYLTINAFGICAAMIL